MIDLKTNGYTVIPNFLTQEEIDMFLADYNKVRTNSLDNHPQTINVGVHGVSNKILPKLNQISTASGLTADMIETTAGLYTSTESMNMGWHQDHFSYYLNQQLYNYLNFYIILEKDDPMLSGLSVIPFGELAKVLPNQVNKFINSGAKRFEVVRNNTRVFDDENGSGWMLPFSIDTIQKSPTLYPGDLLLMRGDVIHKTQDVLTKRVALSIRFSDSTAPISFRKLQQGCRYKQRWLKDYNFELIFKDVDIMPYQEFSSKFFQEFFSTAE